MVGNKEPTQRKSCFCCRSYRNVSVSMYPKRTMARAPQVLS